jgi:hypothetical protein
VEGDEGDDGEALLSAELQAVAMAPLPEARCSSTSPSAFTYT